jgi:ubiquinone/menaquinone biosynthesis C-methylase UbiE
VHRVLVTKTTEALAPTVKRLQSHMTTKGIMQSRIDEVTEIIRHHWGARASSFDDYIGHGIHTEAQHGAWLALLKSFTDDHPQKVLDIGCGTGFLALMFAELGHTVTGIDLSSEMINVAHEKAIAASLNVEFRVENASSISGPEAVYDIAVARHVIWLLPDPVRAVKSWLRAVRPGGQLVLIEGKWASNEAMGKRAHSIRAKLAAIVYRLGNAASSVVGRQQLAPIIKRTYGHLYPGVEAQLPFSGGPPAQKLVEFLTGQGLRDITVAPLMSEALWGEKPRFPRYIVVGRR